jgi:hypothetical protein
MEIWDLRPKSDLATGMALGIGLLVAPAILPMAWSVVRPLLKGIMKGGMTVYETGHGLVTDAIEGATNLVEEARSEAVRELSAARSK